MRRRKKPRVAWLPQTNANSLGATAVDSDTVYQLLVFNVGGATGESVVAEIPLVLDSQTAIEDTGATLADIESSGYRLRRIVGKIWIQCGQTALGSTTGSGVSTPLSVIVTAGIMVRHAITATGGSTALAANTPDANPALILNTGDPWVWRRSWIVGNNNAAGNIQSLTGLTTPTAGVGTPIFSPLNRQPENNYSELAGGIADGPHVDQKTARVVGLEERLFLDVGATVLAEAPSQPETSPLTIAVITDLRVLGSLRTNVGNRRNSSR